MTEQSMDLAVFDPHAAMVADLVKKNETQEFDHTTEEGETALRSWVHRLRGGKGDIEKARKATKSGVLVYGKKVDARAKELTAPLNKMITENMLPLDEIEAKKRAEAEAIVKAEEDARLAKEAADRAELSRREAEVAKKEAEIKEKEWAEREKRIAVTAAENARAEAELKAEREKLEAVETEKEKARQAERERIAKEQAAKLEEERLAEEERKRVANEEHRENIEVATVEGLVDKCRVDFDTATTIVGAISLGLIPNVTINY